MKFKKIASTAMQLEPEDRATLAAALWDSLEDPWLSPEELSDDEAIQLALQRSLEIERGEIEPISMDELMQRLRKDADQTTPKDKA